MSNSMISTVLEIEREAEDVLAKAAREAAALAAASKEQCAAASKAAEDATKREVGELESKAATEREKKARELTATGEAALSAVKNISEAAYDSGVDYVMKALAGK